MSRAIQEALELLGVTRSSDPSSVARAYRRLARANHPDVSAEPDAAQRFSRLTEAYHLVRDQAPGEPADDPQPTEWTASPTGRLEGNLSAEIRLVPGGWFWSTPFGSSWHPDRPPIVAGPVRVTPTRPASMAQPNKQRNT